MHDEDETVPLAYGAIQKKPSNDEVAKEKNWLEEDDHDDDDIESAPLSPPDDELKDSKDNQGEEEVESTNRTPRKGVCLSLFHVLEFMGILASIGLLATQALPLFFIPMEEIGLLQLALRMYVSMFCLSIILVEFSVPFPFIRESKILQSYFSRGFIYSFIGLIGMEESYAVTVKALTVDPGAVAHQYDALHISWAPLFILASSWLMVVSGVIYMLLGICCMKRLRDKLRKTYEKKMKRYNERKKENHKKKKHKN